MSQVLDEQFGRQISLNDHESGQPATATGMLAPSGNDGTDVHPLHSSWEFWYYKRPIKNGNNAVTATADKKGDGSTTRQSMMQALAAEDKEQVHVDAELEEEKNEKPAKEASKELSYRQQLKPLGKISSLEQFFAYYAHMNSAQDMPREIDIFFFRHGEVPMWEESPHGGIWITKIRKDDNVDAMWEALLFAMVGEQFAEQNVIGVSLSLRTKEKLLQIWLKDASNMKMRAVVSNKMRHFLKLDPDSTTLYFKEHQNSIKDKSTMKNALGYKFEKKKKDADAKTDGGANSERPDQMNHRKNSDNHHFNSSGGQNGFGFHQQHQKSGSFRGNRPHEPRNFGGNGGGAKFGGHQKRLYNELDGDRQSKGRAYDKSERPRFSRVDQNKLTE